MRIITLINLVLFSACSASLPTTPSATGTLILQNVCAETMTIKVIDTYYIVKARTKEKIPIPPGKYDVEIQLAPFPPWSWNGVIIVPNESTLVIPSCDGKEDPLT